MNLFFQLSNTHSDYYLICWRKGMLKNKLFFCISIVDNVYIVTTTDDPGRVDESLDVGVRLPHMYHQMRKNSWDSNPYKSKMLLHWKQ